MKAANDNIDPVEMLIRQEIEELRGYSPLVNDVIQLVSESYGPNEISDLTQKLIKLTSDQVFVSVDRLNMRAAPSTGEPVVKILNTGSRLRRLDPSPMTDADGNQWLQVLDPQGARGFVLSQYVSRGTETVSDEIIRVIRFLQSMGIIDVMTSEDHYLVNLTDRGWRLTKYMLDREGRHG